MSRPVPALPPSAVKLMRLFLSSTFPGERDTARRKAEPLLSAEVGGFDRALRILAYQDVMAKADPCNFQAGFDEHYEIDHPGHMAEQAAKRAEKRLREDGRRAELLAEFGSFDAVLKPCGREKALLAAVKPWRKVQRRPYQRWTLSLAGLGTYDSDKAPADLVAAIEAALPMPQTYAEAVAETEFWSRRNDDMELALYPDGGPRTGDYVLDQPCLWRWWRVRDLVDHGMVLHTLPEIIERMRAYRWNGSGTDTDVEDALLRDLEALAAGVAGRVAAPEMRPNASVFEQMAERLRLGVGAAAEALLYRNESEDVLAYTLTGMQSGPERDAAVVVLTARIGEFIPDAVREARG